MAATIALLFLAMAIILLGAVQQNKIGWVAVVMGVLAILIELLHWPGIK